MASVHRSLDLGNPPYLSQAERERLDAMTGDEITRAAESDPDNPPLTDAELARLSGARIVRLTREKTGLSQARFAAAFRINPARLRDWEQGRSTPDSASLAYLRVIEREPDAVRRALETAV
jgi:putative transcriptional regulator